MVMSSAERLAVMEEALNRKRMKRRITRAKRQQNAIRARAKRRLQDPRLSNIQLEYIALETEQISPQAVNVKKRQRVQATTARQSLALKRQKQQATAQQRQIRLGKARASKNKKSPLHLIKIIII